MLTGLGGGAAQVASMDALYRECFPRLRRQLQQKLGTVEEADEVAQDAFANLMARGDEAVILVRGYLFRTAFNLATDRLRSRRLWRECERVDPATLELACVAPGPDRVLSGHDEVRSLHAALADLPAPCRHAFRRHRLEGHSYAEIAAEMGVSESMVRKHVLRATRHCRDVAEGRSG